MSDDIRPAADPRITIQTESNRMSGRLSSVKIMMRVRLTAERESSFAPSGTNDQDLRKVASDAGTTLLALCNQINGIEVSVIGKNHVSLLLVDVDLWSWEELRPVVLGAVAKTLGVEEVEIVREATTDERWVPVKS